jgi:predicted dehydrogenase
MAKEKAKVKIAIIGIGNMGGQHIGSLLANKDCSLVAVCDSDPKKLEAAKARGEFKLYSDHKKLLKDKICDAVVIATPHYDHTTIGIEALNAGYHVLVEKPLSVHKNDCERLISAYKKTKKQVFSAMFNQRTEPEHVKIKQLLDKKELGKIMRVNWIITDWFRTEHYYSSGGWRATWGGEGGGVLINQCPHQLDLLQWFCGMPSKVQATCAFGKYHKIEVEDDVTALLEYPNGATGVFITSTGEAPGTNRLEITGTQGKLVYENGKITFTRNEIPCDKQCKTAKMSFQTPEKWVIDVPPARGHGGGHSGILKNFINAIAKGEKLIAPAIEGINSVEIGNAMLYSSILGKAVSLPLNGNAFEKELKKLIKTSTFKKKVVKGGAASSNEMAGSF